MCSRLTLCNTALLVLVFTYVPVPIHAEEIQLKSGSIYSGEILDEDETTIYIETAEGIINIPRAQILETDDASSTQTQVSQADREMSYTDGSLGLAGPLAAHVGSGGITEQEFEYYLIRKGKDGNFNPEDLDMDARRAHLNTAIDDEILFQEALRLELHEEAQIRANIIDSYQANVTLANVSPENMHDDELKTYYRKHPDKFMTKAQFKYKVLNVNQFANDAASMAKRAMRDPNKVNGWKDSGWQDKGASLYIPYSEAQYNQIYSMKTGDVLELKSSLAGWNIFWLVDHKRPEKIAFEKAHAKIKHELIKAKQTENTTSFKESLKEIPSDASFDQKIFRQALKNGEHRKRQFRSRLINTFIHQSGKDRATLLSELRDLYDVRLNL